MFTLKITLSDLVPYLSEKESKKVNCSYVDIDRVLAVLGSGFHGLTLPIELLDKNNQFGEVDLLTRDFDLFTKERPYILNICESFVKELENNKDYSSFVEKLSPPDRASITFKLEHLKFRTYTNIFSSFLNALIKSSLHSTTDKDEGYSSFIDHLYKEKEITPREFILFKLFIEYPSSKLNSEIDFNDISQEKYSLEQSYPELKEELNIFYEEFILYFDRLKDTLSKRLLFSSPYTFIITDDIVEEHYPEHKKKIKQKKEDIVKKSLGENFIYNERRYIVSLNWSLHHKNTIHTRYYIHKHTSNSINKRNFSVKYQILYLDPQDPQVNSGLKYFQKFTVNLFILVENLLFKYLGNKKKWNSYNSNFFLLFYNGLEYNPLNKKSFTYKQYEHFYKENKEELEKHLILNRNITSSRYYNSKINELYRTIFKRRMTPFPKVIPCVSSLEVPYTLDVFPDHLLQEWMTKYELEYPKLNKKEMSSCLSINIVNRISRLVEKIKTISSKKVKVLTKNIFLKEQSSINKDELNRDYIYMFVGETYGWGETTYNKGTSLARYDYLYSVYCKEGAKKGKLWKYILYVLLLIYLLETDEDVNLKTEETVQYKNSILNDFTKEELSLLLYFRIYFFPSLS